MNPVPAHLMKYVEYIRNTNRRPLSVEAFDYDWEPIGPMVRRELLAAGVIYMETDDMPFPGMDDGIFLRPDLDE